MSLDKLASSLSKAKLKIVHFEFSKLSIEIFDLLTQKGVFPYIVHRLNGQAAGHVLTAQIVLQFLDRRHCIRERLRARREHLAAVFR